MSQTTTLTPPQINWIETAIGGVDKVDAAAALLQRKEELLAAARNRIESGVGTIKVGEDFFVEMKGNAVADFIRQKLDRKLLMASIGEDADPNEDFDSGHDMKDVKGIDPGDFKRLMDAQALIATEVAKLQKEYDLASRTPLFTDREISDAIWAPLMRRKLIPENAIPKRYSEVSRTFDGASGAYQERLAAYTDGLGKFEKLCESLGVAKDVLDAATETANAVIGDLASLDVKFDVSTAKDCITLINVTLSGGASTLQTMLREAGNDDLSFKDKVANAAGAIIKQAAKIGSSAATVGFDQYGDWGSDLGKVVGDGISMAVSGGSAIVKIKKGKYREALGDIADIVASACDCAYNVNQSKTDSKTYTYDPSNAYSGPSVNMSELGMFIAAGIRSGAAAEAFIEKMIKGTVKVEDIGALLGDVFREAVASSSKWMADQVESKKESEAKDKDHARGDDDGRTEFNRVKNVEEPEIEDRQKDGATSEGFAAIGEIIKAIQSKSGKDLEDFLNGKPQFKALAEKIKSQQRSVMDDATESMNEEVAQEAKAFRDMIHRGETGDMEGEIRSVEAMIMAIKRDQMLTDLAAKLISMPAQIVAAFLPQAGIAVSGIELIKNLKLAAEHLAAFMEWQANVADARSAMSVQAEAMVNRAGLEAKQGMEASLKALNAAVMIVGGALSCAGPFAAAGHIATSTTKGVVAIGQLIYKFYDKAKLRGQWKLYLKALNDPEDRKVVRQAIRENPTLAKYVIAYGAVEENNPVARNVMRKCNMSSEVLDSKDTNVQKVEAYLEALYPEDPVLLVAVARPKEWWPGPLELSSASVAAFAGAAEKKTGQKLQRGACKNVIIQLTQLEALDPTFRKGFEEWRKAGEDAGKDPDNEDLDKAVETALRKLQSITQTREMSAQALIGLLKTADPAGADGKPHAEMKAVLKLLLPTAAQLRETYKRDAAGLAAQPGGYQRNPDNGSLE
jgi:hypothetical protein